jgi:hypothetical protein
MPKGEGLVAQVTENLLSQDKALISNPRTSGGKISKRNA